MSDKPLTDISFSSFDLHPSLLAGLESAGFTRCTPIQAMTLPVALKGGDVAGQAQTGTGKTLAFLVAVINRLLSQPALADRKPEDPRALILAPTRELAIQIHKDAVKFGSELGLKFALVYGGVDYDKQRELLQQGVDVIIATPGRLIDYVKQHKVVSLHACEICVLDEADRMFDLGFIKDIRFLLRRMPIRTERQTLLFSATLSHRVLELAYEHMNEPEKLVVESEFITNAKVRQLVYFPSDEEKIPLLLGLLSRSEGARTMVFVNTKAWVERVARALERAGYRVGVLSGDVPQKKRESLLNKFQKGQLELLVATDVAARGLHIDGVSHVYNYDLPFDAEDYVHRIGRTARLGAEGDAISFACERYAMSLPDIETYIEQKLPTAPVEADLLVALPRPKRERPESDDGDDAEEESIGAIFKEAREQRAAEEERRGGGRGKGHAGAGRGAGGRGPGAGEGARGARRPRRDAAAGKPRSGEDAGAPEATAQPAPDTAKATPAAVDPATGEQQRPPRKRRRRRGGRKVEGQAVEGGQAQGNAAKPARAPSATSAETEARGPRAPRQVAANKVPPRAKAPADADGEKPGLFGRIKRGLKSLVTREPSSRH
ncbi:ATP-dependent RNA helicase RhlB [Lysobacter spongiicola]|uniref:ATP-dependent RNA helicase RhlB n=2 Tax=Novilysobacter TaxID=3382699 RepID=A0A1T4PS11_9GAMM|nr:ATP-dependent RNA helicase RhlB [Lysobacter spongiicola DSM 21749]